MINIKLQTKRNAGHEIFYPIRVLKIFKIAEKII